MRYLLCSILLFAVSCKSEYKGLQAVSSNPKCISKFTGGFETGWFKATVDVYGHHLSGLLLIKNSGQGDYRTVLTSEAGVTLFDFAFAADGGFQVKKIIKQMDRKPVINTLREDFSLLLRIPFRHGKFTVQTMGDEVYTGAGSKKETAYLVTDKNCSLKRLEVGSKRKRKVSILVNGAYDSPEALEINHHTFDMVIKLRKIERE
jgi:VCBS repeat-containing protein